MNLNPDPETYLWCDPGQIINFAVSQLSHVRKAKYHFAE